MSIVSNLLEMFNHLLDEGFFRVLLQQTKFKLIWHGCELITYLVNRREQVHVFNEALVEVVHVQLQVHQRSLSVLEPVPGNCCWLVVDVDQDVLEAPPVRDLAVPQDLGAAVPPILILPSELHCFLQILLDCLTGLPSKFQLLLDFNFLNPLQLSLSLNLPCFLQLLLDGLTGLDISLLMLSCELL